MARQWFELPGEVRMMIYRELFRSTSIRLHPKRKTWYYTDSEDGYDREMANCSQIEDCTNEDGVLLGVDKTCASVDLNDDNYNGNSAIDDTVQATTSRAWVTMLATSKKIRREAEMVLYAEASFTIENRVGDDRYRYRLEIDRRIRHLTIEHETDLSLWYETIAFLDRHFHGKDIVMEELNIRRDEFWEGCDDGELKSFLEITSRHVNTLSFRMYVDEYLRRCQMRIPRYGEIHITTPEREGFRQVRRRLRKAQEQPLGRDRFHWLEAST